MPQVKPLLFSTLPPEILLLVYKELHLPAKLALKLTSRHIYFALPPLGPRTPGTNIPALSKCARAAITTYLDYEHKRQEKTHCHLCHEWYATAHFQNPWAANDALLERELSAQLQQDGVDALGGPGMVDVPSGICAWHRGHFCLLVTGPPAPSPLHDQHMERYPMQSRPQAAVFPHLARGWWSIPSLMCLHCRQVHSPLRRAEESAVMAMAKLCQRMALWGACPWCDGCDSCGVVEATCYVRIGGRRTELIEAKCTVGGPEEAIQATRIDGESEEEEAKQSQQIFTTDPGRFVIYRRDGEAWVREWETSTYLSYLPLDTSCFAFVS